MYIITVVVGVLLFFNINVNAIKTRDEIINEINDLKYLISRRTHKLSAITLNMTKMTLDELQEYKTASVEKSTCKFFSTRNKIRTAIPTNIDSSYMYSEHKECFERSEDMLRRRFSDMGKVNCTNDDLEPLNYMVARINKIVQSGVDIIKFLDETILNCATNHTESIVECIEGEMSLVTNAYKFFDYKFRDAKEMSRFTLNNLNYFPCLRRRVRTFFRHANTIKVRADLCIREKDTIQLLYADADLVRTCTVDIPAKMNVCRTID